MSPMPTAQSVERRQSHGLHCRIGHDLYRLVELADAQPLVRTAEMQPPRVDTGANPEDLRPEAGVFYSLSEFGGGEGQAHVHRPTSEPNRFWDSRGVDVAPPTPGRPATFTLLRTPSSIVASTSTTPRATYNATSIFVTDGTSVQRVDDPLATTPPTTLEDPHAGETATDVLDITSLGSTVYVALGTNGIHRRVNGTWEHWSDLEADRIWAMKGRVVAAKGAELYEADAATNSSLIYTLAPSHTFEDVIDAGQFIMAGATNGTIYAFTADEGATITVATQSPVSKFEGITVLGFHSSGLIFWGTDEPTENGTIGRLYRGGVTEHGTVSFATLIRQWGDYTTTADRSLHAIASFRESMYTATDEETHNTHLWRYDLETAGRVRHLDTGGNGTVHSIIPIGDRLFFTRDDTGLLREGVSDYTPSGYIITSLADHFTASDKNWASVNLDVEALNGGFVELWYTTNPDAILDSDHSSWIRAKRVESETDDFEAPISAVSRYIALKVVLYAGFSNTATPSVRSAFSRSFPGPADIVMQLPINTSDQIEAPGKRRLRARGLGYNNYNRLKSIEGTNQEVVLYSPPETVYGVIEHVATPVMALTSRGSRTLVSMVQVRGRRTGAVATTSAYNGMGIGAMGIPIMGGVTNG